MTTCYLSPIGNSPQSSTSGAPLNAGQVFTYQAGTTTPVATYTDSTGATPQANPIVLNTYGLPSSPIWLTAGQAYKFVIKDSLGNTIRTIDTVSGIDDPVAITASQFALPGFASSLAASGYQKLPSGLIVQWGTATTSAGTGTITFPIAFPTVCRSLVIAESAASGWSTTNLTVYGVSALTSSGATIKSLTWTGSSFSAAGGGVFYQAIGY